VNIGLGTILASDTSTNISRKGSQPLRDIKIIGSLCKAAKEQGLDSPQRLWWLARAIDDGSGRVSHQALMNTAEKHITKALRSRQALLKTCKAQGWLKECQSKDGSYWYIIHSLERMAKQFKTELTTPAIVSARELKSIGKWRVACWDATMGGRKGHKGRPIARKTLERITGVETRSQQRYEKQSKRITSQKNIVIAHVSKTQVDGYKEFKGKPAFPVGDHIGWQTGSSYDVDISLTPRGQTTEINKTLRHSNLIHTDMSDTKIERLYYHKQGSGEKVMRKEEHPKEVYQATGRRTGHKDSPKKVWVHIG